MTVGGGELHNDDLHNLYAASYITVNNKLRMKGVGHATRVEDIKTPCKSREYYRTENT
jgi:argininosuccinate synthase